MASNGQDSPTLGAASTSSKTVAEIRERMMYGGMTQAEFIASPAGQYRESLVSKPFASASTINSQAVAIPQLIAAEGEVIPEIFGTARVAARLATATVYNGELYMLVVWCGGPVAGVVKVLNGDVEIAGAKMQHHLGGTPQTADSWMVAAIAGYSDTLDGICYSVIKFGQTDSINPRLIAEIQGHNDIYDPRGTPSTGYSDNPSLCLAYIIDNYTTSTVNWTSVATCADANDEVLTGSKRRVIGLALETAASIKDVEALFREYSGCFVQWSEPVNLIPNRPRAVDHTFGANKIKSINLKKRGMDALPNRVTVRYTDTSATEWKQAQATVSDIVAGAEIRAQIVDEPGIKDHAQATRQATERLNYYRLIDLDASIDVFDEGLEVVAGDVISVTHPYGLANKELRVLSAVATDAGRWKLVTEEYNSLLFSDAVVSKGSASDTNLPMPGIPSAPTSLVLGEVVYSLQAKAYGSKLRISWTASTNPYVSEYRVSVTLSSAVIYETTVDSSRTTVDTPALKESETYTVSVYAISPYGVSTALSGTKAMLGKYIQPTGAGMVLSGLEVGGQVRLSWTPDTSDFDIQSYELRYGLTSGSWDTATFIDRIDAFNKITNNIPPGTWRFYVKSYDSVGQYSTNSSYKDIVVTLDDNAMLVGSQTATEGSYANMLKTKIERDGPDVYISTSAQTWNTVFSSASAFNTAYPGICLSYQTPAGNSEWISADWDAVQVAEDRTGDWLAENIVLSDISNTATQQMALKPNGGAFGAYGNLSQKATARYAKIRLQSAGLFRFQMAPLLQLNAVVREERGDATSSASTYLRVTLANSYAAAQSIIITPVFTTGTKAVSCVVDNLVVGATTSFDVYIFDVASPTTKLAVPFKWAFKGV